MPWRTASLSFSEFEDGLYQPWCGRVWLNPPYGPLAAEWLKKLSRDGNGIAVIFARTETAMFFEHVWRAADAMLFLEGRLHFYHPSGKRAAHNGGAPSVLIAYGQDNAARLAKSGLRGAYIDLTMQRSAA